MTENKTISISYLNSNTWMIFSILRSLQSLLQISRISNWQPSSLKWQAGSMGQITYKTQQTKQKNIKRSSGAETLTSSHKNPDSSLFLKTQKTWQHNTRIPTWPQSAMAEQVPPSIASDLPCSPFCQLSPCGSPVRLWMCDHCHTQRRHGLYLSTLQIYEPCTELLRTVKKKKKSLDIPSQEVGTDCQK